MSLDLERDESVDRKGRMVQQPKDGGRIGAAFVCGMPFFRILHCF